MRLPNPAFWQGRRVLLTGHTGFKGSWLALWLAELGAQVTGLALPPATDPSLFRLLGLDGVIRSRFGDVRDVRAVDDAMAEADPEIVFHLAAQPLVRAGYREPAATFAINVMGTVNVLESIRRRPGVRALVVVTTDKCYAPRSDGRPYRENDALGGDDPYSASKAGAEIVTAAYRQSYFGGGPAVATVRAGNVIGGGDWSPERLVTDVVHALHENAPLVLRYPQAVRPWQHVLDPLCAYLVLAERLFLDGDAYARGWNVGPEPDVVATVEQVVRAFARAWGRAVDIVGPTERQPHEASVLRLDSTEARTALPWQPLLALDDAVAWTAAWYRAAETSDATRAITSEQLASYARLASTSATRAR
jgi:CDP-glucose 4,6-dehydratase